MPSIYDQTATIRDLINRPWKQSRLYQSRPAWLQLTSALDVIGDTELAIDASSVPAFGESEGTRYLAVYGLLQALYTQQDAVASVCRALNIQSVTISSDWHELPVVRTVRDVRNQAIGHPTRKGWKAPYSYHFISRISLSPNGFELLSTWDDGREEWCSVSLPELVAAQRHAFGEVLEAVIAEMRADEEAHRARFRMEEMVNLFPATLPYGFQNLVQATRPESDLARVAIARAVIDEIRAVLSAFTDAARARGVAEALHLDWTYEEYALDTLGEYCDRLVAHESPQIDHQAAYILAFFLEKQIDYLRHTATEIDEDLARGAV